MTTRFRSILVPLDGSDVAEQALPVAASLARRAGAALHLVSVHEPVPTVVAGQAGLYGVNLEQECRDGLSEYLAKTVSAARRGRRVEIQGELVDGKAAQALADYVDHHGIGLVVMTTHARQGLARWLLGSVAAGLLRRLSVPVLLLHPAETPPAVRFHRILIALDGDIEDPVLEPAIALAALGAKTEFVLIRIVCTPIPVITGLASSPTHFGIRPPEPSAEAAASRYLEQVADRLRAGGWSVMCRVVEARDIAESVIGLAHSVGADCIAVGTHGATGVDRLLVGSVAENIVRQSELPVLVGPG